MITSESAVFKTQYYIFSLLSKSPILFLRSLIFKFQTILSTFEVMMNIGVKDRMHFWMNLLNRKPFGHGTWPISSPWWPTNS